MGELTGNLDMTSTLFLRRGRYRPLCACGVLYRRLSSGLVDEQVFLFAVRWVCVLTSGLCVSH